MCWARMWLTRIEPDKPGYDKRTFECAQCKFTMTETVKYTRRGDKRSLR